LLARLDEPATSLRTRESCRDLLRRLRDESRATRGRDTGDAQGGAAGGSDPRDDGAFRAWAVDAIARRHDPRPSRPKLRRISGAEVIIETDVTDDDRLHRLTLDLGRMRRAYGWFFERRSGESPEPVRVKLFADRRDFERYGATHDFNFQFFNEFYYSFLLREIVAFDIPNDESLLLRRLHHELCHDYYERALGMPPVWFNEGTAEVLEVAKLDAKGELALERNTEWEPRLNDARREGGLPSLRELLALSPERFYADDAPRNYAAAWSFMDFLLRGFDTAGVDLARRIFSTLRDRRGADVSQTLDDAGLNHLEDEWRAALAKTR
jgi:hypothetical protein